MAPTRIVLAGGTGFLGQCLIRHFRRPGVEIVVLSREQLPAYANVRYARWDGRTLDEWAAELDGADVLVNLAGRSVDCRYHEANRRAILSSRVDSTRVLGAAVAACRRPPRVWLNAATATIYEHTEGERPANTEADGVIGRGFSVEVAQAWEEAFWACPAPNTRRVALRTAIVLGADGGAFPVLARLARWGLCTPQGSGRQWISWLHATDFARAVEFLAQQPGASGVFNLCAPQPIQNRDFNALLARTLRPLLRLPQPEWLLEAGAWALQTQTELVLKSRKVYPQRLLEWGFEFQFPGCKAAVADIVRTVEA
ncbi:TIGR01777 family oxidoreductase [Hymenobacter jeollabukensis]|uniref:TIGR01777 family protein n=1 Tax=Hymenobacter jeollabukensis TaxID=2025313 RepID=A0A5R8WP83_9BACT|nr:TIGR01777 family oxidoreductase [Hymenobacter jeollabukensis]TLM91849.1 TIGR01777 family protein [Hymenobacter jeollabukensis]